MITLKLKNYTSREKRILSRVLKTGMNEELPECKLDCVNCNQSTVCDDLYRAINFLEKEIYSREGGS